MCAWKHTAESRQILITYGIHARELLPQLRELRAEFRKPDDNSALLDQTIDTIEKSATTPPLISLEDIVKSHAMYR